MDDKKKKCWYLVNYEMIRPDPKDPASILAYDQLFRECLKKDGKILKR